MFEKKRSIVYIQKDTIKGGLIRLTKPPQVKKGFESSWSIETLPEVLRDIKKQLGSNIRIVLHDDFVYTALVKSDAPLDTNQAVKEKAKELIPEDLDQTVWDTREVILPDSQAKTYQILAFVRASVAPLMQAFADAKLRAACVQPLSLTLSQSVVPQGDTTVIVHKDTRTILVAAYKDIVLATDIREQPVGGEGIMQFIEFLKQEYNITTQKIILSGIDAPDMKGLEAEGYVAETIYIDAVLTLAQKNIKDHEDDAFTLAFARTKPKKYPPVAKSKKEHARFLPIFFVILFLVLTAGGIFLYLGQAGLPESKTAQPQTLSPTETPVPEEAEEENAVDISLFSIAVLNGSGRAGAGAKLSDLLKENGFTVTTLGNAANRDVEGVEIRAKKTVPQSFLETLDKAIENNYAISIHHISDENQETDVVIIIDR